MAIDLKSEVALLKKLKKRFSSNDLYFMSIQDMYEEGLITQKAFRSITNWLANIGQPKTSVSIKSNVGRNRVIPRKEIVQEVDPCSHGGGSFRNTSC